MKLLQGWGARSDRGLALGLAVLAAESLVSVRSTEPVDRSFLFVVGLLIFGYLAALWFSRPWGLLTFGALSIPMGGCAKMLSFGVEGRDVLSRIAESPLWICLALYGFLRACHTVLQNNRSGNANDAELTLPVGV